MQIRAQALAEVHHAHHAKDQTQDEDEKRERSRPRKERKFDERQPEHLRVEHDSPTDDQNRDAREEDGHEALALATDAVPAAEEEWEEKDERADAQRDVQRPQGGVGRDSAVDEAVQK